MLLGSDSNKELLLQYNVMKMERHTDMYKILIIEDDAVISEQVSRYLARWGVRDSLCGGFREYPAAVCLLCSTACASGYRAAFLQWLLLVRGDQEGFAGAGGVRLLGFRQYEHRDGDEYGRG